MCEKQSNRQETLSIAADDFTKDVYRVECLSVDSTTKSAVLKNLMIKDFRSGKLKST